MPDEVRGKFFLLMLSSWSLLVFLVFFFILFLSWLNIFFKLREYIK